MASTKYKPSDLSGTRAYDTFKKILTSWKPEHPDHVGWKPKNEYDWQQSLFGHLQDRTEGIIVDKEKGKGRGGRADLILSYRYLLQRWHHVIELKKGLSSAAKVGDVRIQVEDYYEKDNSDFVWVVVCGEPVEERFLRHLADSFPAWWKRRPAIYWKKIDGSVSVVFEPA